MWKNLPAIRPMHLLTNRFVGVIQNLIGDTAKWNTYQAGIFRNRKHFLNVRLQCQTNLHQQTKSRNQKTG